MALGSTQRTEQQSTFKIAARVRHSWLLVFSAILLIAILGSACWVGYQGSDDGTYTDAAIDLLKTGSFLASDHWALRYPVVMPIALGFRVFGLSEAALGVPMLIYLGIGVTVTMALLLSRFGRVEAALFAAIFCTMPGVIVLATYADADMPELCFVALSVGCFLAASPAGSRVNVFLILSGVFAGLAFMTRETTAGLLLGYGVLFVAKPLIPRRSYFVMGLGFALVLGGEMAYFAMATGDPLYRFTVDLHHDHVDRAAAVAKVVTSGNLIDKEGNLIVGGLFSPLLVFFASQKYGLAFYLAVGLLPITWIRASDQRCRRFILSIAVLGLSWCAFILGGTHVLYIVPRYFLVAAWAAAILAAVGLSQLWNTRRRVAIVLIVGTLSVNGLGLYVENKDAIQASRTVVDIAKASTEPVYTDPLTKRRGRLVAEIAGVENKIRTQPPPAGVLYAFAPDNILRCATSSCGFQVGPYRPNPGWILVDEYVPHRRAIGWIFTILHVQSFIPYQLKRKIEMPNAGVFVYRVR